jgi:hemolysin activation/secretion protein
MKFPSAKVFALTFLITTFSFLNGEEEEPTLFVDSINLQVMTELRIPGKDDPLKITQEKFYNIPFSEEKKTFTLFAYPLSEDVQETITAIYHFLLRDAPSGEYTFSAINKLQSQIANLLIAAGYYGIAVVVDPDQIDVQTGDDFRDGNDKSLNFQIWIGGVVKSRTIGKGKRIKETNLINHPLHRKIIERSPFAANAEAGKFLIDKPALDNYLERLNQNSRRRVDIALSSAGVPGDVILDYIVSESKPWTAYVQVSNTGTEATGEWRERIGGVHYQLTNNDDVLTVDYLTAEFDRANAVLASYEYPLLRPNYLDFVISGSYSDFAAENLVNTSLPDSEGETISFSGDLVYTPFYLKEHAISFVAGFLLEDIDFRTSTLSPININLFSPYLQFEVSKQKQLHSSFFSVSYEKNINTRDDDETLLQNTGRLESTIDHEIVQFDFYQSFFIEPLLPTYYKTKPEKWLANALIHELTFSLRGQYTLDDARIITQKQIFGGGFFSVRGYDESAARGDSGIIGSAEYRIHLARLLKPASMLKEIDPKDQTNDQKVRNRFNYRAPSLYGVPDWDFMVRGFVDWANFTFNKPESASSPDEVNQDLASIGIGFEFQYKGNLNIRLDYGLVREELQDYLGETIDDADQGDSRFHFLATYSF